MQNSSVWFAKNRLGMACWPGNASPRYSLPDLSLVLGTWAWVCLASCARAQGLVIFQGWNSLIVIVSTYALLKFWKPRLLKGMVEVGWWCPTWIGIGVITTWWFMTLARHWTKNNAKLFSSIDRWNCPGMSLSAASPSCWVSGSISARVLKDATLPLCYSRKKPCCSDQGCFNALFPALCSHVNCTLLWEIFRVAAYAF